MQFENVCSWHNIYYKHSLDFISSLFLLDLKWTEPVDLKNVLITVFEHDQQSVIYNFRIKLFWVLKMLFKTLVFVFDLRVEIVICMKTK